MPIAIVSWRTWMLRKGFQPNQKSPVDPAESEVTQWLNPRNWNDPRRMSGVISCPCQKRRICRGRPGCRPVVLVPLGQRSHFLYAPDPSERLVPGTADRTKKGPEKSDPTPLSYHIRKRKSMPKCPPVAKICALHKNDCLHLGNIPSWKVEKSVLSYSHKEEIQKQ